MYFQNTSCHFRFPAKLGIFLVYVGNLWGLFYVLELFYNTQSILLNNFRSCLFGPKCVQAVQSHIQWMVAETGLEFVCSSRYVGTCGCRVL